MPVQQTAVGKSLSSSEYSVSVRDVLAYAAGIGDTSPGVFDDLEEGLSAPPAYCVSLEWPVVSHPDARAHLGAEPEELLRGVHVVQDSHFHKPIRPGQTLRTSGQIVDVRATRAGALSTTRLLTTDQSGEVLVTSWTSSIYRGVAVAEVEQLEVDSSRMVPPSVPPRPEGLVVQRSRVFIPREMAHVYSECARIWNPIHTERRVALAAGLPDIILHGTATWALAGREIVRAVADADSSRLERLHGRFTGMVLLGTEIEIVMAASSTGEVWFEVHDHAGKPVLTHGFARASLP